MSTPHAAGVSATKPLHGQDHRSGPDFQFLPTVPEKGTITVHIIKGDDNPEAIVAKMKERSGTIDPTITTIKEGSTFDGDKLSWAGKYYIADPSGATATFVVYFTH